VIGSIGLDLERYATAYSHTISWFATSHLVWLRGCCTEMQLCSDGAGGATDAVGAGVA
jgi:hypothetical protein